MQAEEKIRINKYLAMSGICSRRDADKLIEQGQVSINGKVAATGDKVSKQDIVQVGKKKIQPESKKVVLAFYKPLGIVCTERDPHAEKIIMDLIHYPIRVTYAGRLDKDSEGLLLLTNDGELIQSMMRGANGHEKEYVVKTDKEITDDFIQKMEQGVYLKELDIHTRPCKMEKSGKYTFHITLTQGVNRQIRRMCQTFGYQVNELKRIRVMNITLDGLKNGQFRELTEEELMLLYKMCGLNR
ncbi:MAG TPA: pseudouridine synthase [Lachnospiraceae bacterium]|nr:pseudouridine synthase [Lachnospiraceae bacterium]